MSECPKRVPKGCKLHLGSNTALKNVVFLRWSKSNLDTDKKQKTYKKTSAMKHVTKN